MTVQKRGLGRGLEALLVNVPVKDSDDVEPESLQAETVNLLKEAENLESLLSDFENLVRNFNTE